MKLLILGGTGWLSGHVAQQALDAGHEVTCFSRSITGALPQGARLLCMDRGDPASDDLLAAQHWDAVADVSSQPGRVRRASAALAPHSGHFVYVSSASVYAQNDLVGADESVELLGALKAQDWTDMSHCGAAKVACEQHVRAAFGSQRCTIARAGLIGGPPDVSDRSG